MDRVRNPPGLGESAGGLDDLRMDHLCVEDSDARAFASNSQDLYTGIQAQVKGVLEVQQYFQQMSQELNKRSVWALDQLKQMERVLQLAKDQSSNFSAVGQQGLSNDSQLVRELQQRVTELENRLAQSHSSAVLNSCQEDIDRLTVCYKKKYEDLECEKMRMQEQVNQLRAQNTELLEYCGKLLPNKPNPAAADEQVKWLQAQIRTCVEDFQTERRDRERAQHRISSLEEECSLLREQLKGFQAPIMAQLGSRGIHHHHAHQSRRIECDSEPSGSSDDIVVDPRQDYDEVDQSKVNLAKI